MTKKTTDTPVVSPLLDVHGNPTPVAPGQLIESAWGNSVATRVVTRYPSPTELFAASASDGTLAVTTDRNVVWIHMGGGWRPTAMGNTIAFRLDGGPPGQALPASVMTVAHWATEDDVLGLVSGGTFTVPPFWAGRYGFNWSVDFAAGGGASTRFAFLQAGVHRFGETNVVAEEGGNRFAGAADMFLPEGAQVNVVIYHTDTVNPLTVNATTNTHFIGHYMGPT